MTEIESNYEELDERVTMLDGANWAILDGQFTPSELRKIARDIEKNFKKVPKSKARH